MVLVLRPCYRRPVALCICVRLFITAFLCAINDIFMPHDGGMRCVISHVDRALMVMMKGHTCFHDFDYVAT